MALSLGVKRGRKILIGGELLQVQEILAPNQVRITFQGRTILVTDEKREKLMEDVFVQCGLNADAPKSPESRLAFEAPRRIRIERVRS